MKLTKLDRARLKARHSGKYRVLRHRNIWYVVTPRGVARPCVTWGVAMSSLRRVAA